MHGGARPAFRGRCSTPSRIAVRHPSSALFEVIRAAALRLVSMAQGTQYFFLGFFRIKYLASKYSCLKWRRQ